jgi:hypothetical protein
MSNINRLTARSPKNGMAYLVNVKKNEQDPEGPYNTLLCVRDAFEKLAVYEDTVPEMIEALQRALTFMMNGVDNGYIKMPDVGDSALETPNIIRRALAKAQELGNKA